MSATPVPLVCEKCVEPMVIVGAKCQLCGYHQDIDAVILNQKIDALVEVMRAAEELKAALLNEMHLHGKHCYHDEGECPAVLDSKDAVAGYDAALAKAKEVLR